MKAYGVSGTRKGMNEDQFMALTSIVLVQHRDYFKEDIALHHGNCIGVDEEVHGFFHHLRQEEGKYIAIHLHRGCNREGRSPEKSLCTPKQLFIQDIVYEPKWYHDRNQDIVNVADTMIIVPKEDHETQYSGTWSTFRKARKRQLAGWDGFIYILWPKGGYTRLNRYSDWHGRK